MTQAHRPDAAPALGDLELPVGARNAASAALLARALCPKGTLVVVSPGSRSTPLALAFEREPRARTEIVVDERVAGFVALGAARASGRAAIVLCTSGSAMGHYLPAMMEASLARVPLIVISADRPPDLHHCGAAQTLPQAGAFERWTRMSVALPSGDARFDPRWLRNVAAQLLVAAHGSPAGPVHVNAPFAKPLWAPAPPVALLGEVTLTVGRRTLDPDALATLAARLSTERGAIVCGPLAPATLDARALGRAAHKLAASLGWPLLADPASGARYGFDAISSYDAFLPHVGHELAPSMVLAIGQAPTSAALASWLERHARDAVTLLDADGQWNDPGHAAAALIAADPIHTCDALAELSAGAAPRAWLERWRRADAITRAALAASFHGDWEGHVAARVVETIHEGSQLHVASSMAIRDVDAFAHVGHAISVHANRGCNGIDGTLSTLLGEALGSARTTVGLVGDLAFCHDLGGLQAWAASNARGAIVVVNNEGGAIFEQLPIAQQIDRATFDKLFTTPQPLDVGLACAAVGVHHERLRADDVSARLSAALDRDGLSVLEVMVLRHEGVERRARATARVARALEGWSPT